MKHGHLMGTWKCVSILIVTHTHTHKTANKSMMFLDGSFLGCGWVIDVLVAFIFFSLHVPNNIINLSWKPKINQVSQISLLDHPLRFLLLHDNLLNSYVWVLTVPKCRIRCGGLIPIVLLVEYTIIQCYVYLKIGKMPRWCEKLWL